MNHENFKLEIEDIIYQLKEIKAIEESYPELKYEMLRNLSYKLMLMSYSEEKNANQDCATDLQHLSRNQIGSLSIRSVK